MMSNWVNPQAAAEEAHSIKCAATKQLVGSALFRLEAAILDRLLHPASPFDCVYCIHAATAIFSKHTELKTLHTMRFDTASTTNLSEEPFCRLTESLDFIDTLRSDSFQHRGAMFALSELNLFAAKSQPKSTFDLSVFAFIMAYPFQHDWFVLGTIDGIDYSIPMNDEMD